MPVPEYLFIHPWFHPDESWAGFHLDFPGPADAFPAALARLAAHPALPSLDRRLLWFIPVADEAAVAGASFLPETQAVLLLDSANPDREILERRLRQTDYRRGLVLAPGHRLPAGDSWDYAVLPAGQARTLPAQALWEMAAWSAVAVTGLRSRNDFAWAIANHCSLASGEYLLDRSAASHKPDMMRVRLLKLLSLIAADADTREIEEIFRQEPKLAYGLLRLVNSAAMAPRSPITSFAQAIVLLGRQQLQRWLQLLVYADPNSGHHANPLLLQAATRGRLMETLAPRLDLPPELEAPQDAAFMAGAFSLLDILLNLSMPEILQQLPLPAAVHAALEARRGALGTLLTAVAAADNRETDTAGCLLAGLGIDGEAFADAQINALAWASHIRTPTA